MGKACKGGFQWNHPAFQQRMYSWQKTGWVYAAMWRNQGWDLIRFNSFLFHEEHFIRLQHQPRPCQCLVLLKTSPLKRQRLLWCGKLRQPLVTITKALHWERVCRILSRFFLYGFLLKKRLGLYFPAVSTLSIWGLLFKSRLLFLIGNPLSGQGLKRHTEGRVVFSVRDKKRNYHKCICWHIYPVRQVPYKKMNIICRMYVHGGVFLLFLQDATCPFQPTNWCQENTARLCRMQFQAWFGLKTWGTL